MLHADNRLRSWVTSVMRQLIDGSHGSRNVIHWSTTDLEGEGKGAVPSKMPNIVQHDTETT